MKHVNRVDLPCVLCGAEPPRNDQWPYLGMASKAGSVVAILCHDCKARVMDEDDDELDDLVITRSLATYEVS